MMLSFKDMFNSLRRSPVHLLHSLRQASGRRLTSLVLLGMSLGIFAVLRSYAQPLFDRNGLFPAEKDMVPIDHLHIGLFKDVCPGLGTGVTRSEMEECLSQENDLSTKLHLLPIPTLKEILKTQPPRFRDVLTKNNLSKIADGIVNKDVYVIGIDIPKEYFENAEITDTRHVLSFHMIVASTICIDRECSISRARFDPYCGISLN